MPPISDALTKYGSVFQTKIITALLADYKFAVTIYDMLRPELLDTEAKQWIVKNIKEYYYEYKVMPSLQVLKIKLGDVSTDLLRDAIIDELREVTKHLESPDLEFVKNETTTFCKNQVLKEAIVKSVDLLQIGQYDEIKRVIDNAMRAGTHRDIGLNYLKDFDSILDDIARETVKSGWDPIDHIMDGGLSGGELGVVVAPSGIGKSWFLQALGVNALKAGKNVVHYSIYRIGFCYGTLSVNCTLYILKCVVLNFLNTYLHLTLRVFKLEMKNFRYFTRMVYFVLIYTYISSAR